VTIVPFLMSVRLDMNPPVKCHSRIFVGACPFCKNRFPLFRDMRQACCAEARRACEYKAAAGKVKRPRSQYCQAEPSPSNPVADVISRTAPAVACRPD
jgi:hypothetical protein